MPTLLPTTTFNSAASPAPHSDRPLPLHGHGVALSVAAVAIALLVGGVTSYGQLLPGTFNWLANSVAGWSIPMALLVWFTRGGVTRSAITGGLSFVAMSVGYSIVSTLRGYPDTPEMWAAIGIIVGPVLGAAVALLRRSDRRVVAIAAGVLAGIVLGDGVRGLIAVPDGWGTWAIFLAVGTAFVAWVTTSKLRSWGSTALLAAATVVVGGAYVIFTDVILQGLFS